MMRHPWDSDELQPLPVHLQRAAWERILMALYGLLMELGVRR